MSPLSPPLTWRCCLPQHGKKAMLTNRRSLRRRLQVAGGLLVVCLAGWAVAVALYWRRRTAKRITPKRVIETTSLDPKVPLDGDCESNLCQEVISSTPQAERAPDRDETPAASQSSRSLLGSSYHPSTSASSSSAVVFPHTQGCHVSSEELMEACQEKREDGKIYSSMPPWIAFHRVMDDDRTECPGASSAKLQQSSKEHTIQAVHGVEWMGSACEQVFVQGESADAIVLAVLDIQRALAAGRCEAASTTNKNMDYRRTRRFESESEFQLFVQRVKQGRAQPLLRKLFLCQGESCNVEQEIWFMDKENELARADPLKQYTIIHVHHHVTATVLSSEIRDCEKIFEAPVDGVNARHLSSDGYGYQADNPFFDTFVEASGSSTLKVFPKGNWTCAACKYRHNSCSFLHCRNKRDGCTGSRPCPAWRWRQEKHMQPALFQVLQVAAGFADNWSSGGPKDRNRGVHTGTRPSSWMTLKEIYRATEGATLRICALCVGIDDYDFATPLLNCANDASAMAHRIRQCRGAEVVEVVGRSTATELWDKIEGFADLVKGLLKPPAIIIVMFAGPQPA